ncbi:hypothetical protein BGZ47_001093 [Haplosporangium gracile]|nr:hypothetical protein BGZ47_001093 [Haplosporangium gracile]
MTPPSAPSVAPFPPLPPLLRLTRLEAHICFYSKDSFLTPQTGCNHNEHLHQVLWLVRLNSDTLKHLELTELTLTDNGVIRDIARTLSQLHRLETLRMTTHLGKVFTRREFETFFFSCPASLVRCHIANVLHNTWTADGNLDPIIDQDWDYDQGPLVLHTTPLRHLKSLRVPIMPRSEQASVLQSLIQHCPSLEHLQLPFFDNAAKGLQPVIESLAQQCPHISSLTFHSGCLGEYLPRIMELLPAQGLKALFFRHYHDSDSERMIAAISRHSTSLRRIELTHCTRVGSTVIQAVLTTCRTLEVFRVHGRQSQVTTVSISLAHAVEQDWVCKLLRELTIPVWITPDGRDSKYLIVDPSKESWTEDELRYWEDLGRLYTQIGSLTQLEVLNLKAVRQPNITEPNVFLSPYKTWFPHSQDQDRVVVALKSCVNFWKAEDLNFRSGSKRRFQS